MNTDKAIERELDQLLNEMVTPWDTSDLPPGVRITSPSLKIAQAKAQINNLIKDVVIEEVENIEKILTDDEGWKPKVIVDRLQELKEDK